MGLPGKERTLGITEEVDIRCRVEVTESHANHGLIKAG